MHHLGKTTVKSKYKFTLQELCFLAKLKTTQERIKSGKSRKTEEDEARN